MDQTGCKHLIEKYKCFDKKMKNTLNHFIIMFFTDFKKNTAQRRKN